MPTVLFYLGWRFFFFANEGNEPIHIHAEKADKSCKFWLDVESYDILPSVSYKMNQGDLNEVRKIIFKHFDLIVEAWEVFQRRRKNEQ
ncbi:MAG: DUF4160 domain-containing protein [Ignavibacteriales bacterium]|nr:DUF4160 domain-containing protein [Ignavibacteriales bacterium]